MWRFAATLHVVSAYVCHVIKRTSLFNSRNKKKVQLHAPQVQKINEVALSNTHLSISPLQHRNNALHWHVNSLVDRAAELLWLAKQPIWTLKVWPEISYTCHERIRSLPRVQTRRHVQQNVFNKLNEPTWLLEFSGIHHWKKCSIEVRLASPNLKPISQQRATFCLFFFFLLFFSFIKTIVTLIRGRLIACRSWKMKWMLLILFFFFLYEHVKKRCKDSWWF